MTIAAVLEPRSPLLDLLEREFFPENDARAESDDGVPPHVWERALARPLFDFLSRPGKEFRSRFLLTSWELAGGQGELPAELPLVVEILHAGSLIVDDIEDGSDERRGAPALHVSYGVPTALNAGNWLYFWPFALVERLALPAHTELSLKRAMTRALLDCHRGQALDLSVRLGDLTQAEVLPVVRATTQLKTGSLMQLAAAMGAIAAGANASTTGALCAFASALGAALQQLDDLGGITSPRRHHKGYEDLANGRPTWPWAWLAERSDAAEFAELRARASELELGARSPEPLAALMRKRLGADIKPRITAELGRAFDDLKQALGSSVALRALKQELQRLQTSYD